MVTLSPREVRLAFFIFGHRPTATLQRIMNSGKMSHYRNTRVRIDESISNYSNRRRRSSISWFGHRFISVCYHADAPVLFTPLITTENTLIHAYTIDRFYILLGYIVMHCVCQIEIDGSGGSNMWLWHKQRKRTDVFGLQSNSVVSHLLARPLSKPQKRKEKKSRYWKL